MQRLIVAPARAGSFRLVSPSMTMAGFYVGRETYIEAVDTLKGMEAKLAIVA